MASKGARAGARAIDTTITFLLAIAVWILFGDGNRPWTSLFLGWSVVWWYEALLTTWFGGTPGKRIVGLRVIPVDGQGKPPLGVTLRRGAASAALTVLPPISWALWAMSTLGDALGRGFADRAAGTMVVPDRFDGSVTTATLPGYADGVRAPRLHPLGRIGDHDVRVRARLRRLSDSRLLAAAIGLLALAVSLPFATGWIILASSGAWVVVFVAHETWLVHRTGQTPGHELAGLQIRSRRTGEPPSTWRSFWRALVLGTTLYLPVLWPVLAISMLMMRFGAYGRGLHDVAGGTVVVSDPSLDPETQRQRTMRMRLGLAG